LSEVSIQKIDDERQQVFGWAYVTQEDGAQVIDHSREFIKTADLEPAAYEFVLASRASNDMHQGPVTGQMIESFVVTKEKLGLMGIESATEGWWVGFQLDTQSFQAVKRGERGAFSIEGIAEKVAA